MVDAVLSRFEVEGRVVVRGWRSLFIGDHSADVALWEFRGRRVRLTIEALPEPIMADPDMIGSDPT